jgi:alginate O-acetyltransferase complex protein AlgI
MLNLDPTFISLPLLALIFLSIPMHVKSFVSRYGVWYLLFLSLLFYFLVAGVNQLILILVLATITRFAAKQNTRLAFVFATLALCGFLIASKWLIAFDNTNPLHIFIPLGISFFTFEFIHYLSEVKKGSVQVGGARDFYLFSFFFPTVVSGPIKRVQDFTKQLKHLTSPSQDLLVISFQRIALGILYKFAADYLVSQQELAYPQLGNLGVFQIYVFLIIVSMRIFLDFAGYSLIAIGLAGLYGINVPQNFRSPYFSFSLIDFWNRWHISLSSWVRDYLYIPLGGSRKGKLKQSVNLLLAMLVIGLWHGFGINFMIWGLYHGIGLTINHMWKLKFNKTSLVSKKWPLLVNCCKIFTVFTFVSIGWLFFFYSASEAFSILGYFISAIWSLKL